ncbi:Uu.00g129420.m01.CDS01 [Anthostomella pinea]|uniref:Uu.00g129420.m01.CDS01 n=1 Tax=Anthostomella pinea TaxID=933095 RepID=A0AAI8YFN5_9PEZI|nr:Uu.00g129420.m01.CDS01 [Anthostomella pinea]
MPISPFRSRIGFGRSQCVPVLRSFTTTKAGEGAGRVLVARARRALASEQQSQSQTANNRRRAPPLPPNVRPLWRTRTSPQLCPFNARKVTTDKLVRMYTRRLNRNNPLQIRNLPGFLESQVWIEHANNPDGSFKIPRLPLVGSPTPDFALLRDILASANPGIIDNKMKSGTSQPSQTRAVFDIFDDLEAECKITRGALRANIRPWSSSATGCSSPNAHRSKPMSWVPFKASLGFVRAVYQYNRAREAAHEQGSASCIAGLYGLVVLKETLYEEFPFRPIIRDIGSSTYSTKSCSLRVGVRPLRADMRRYKHSTVVIGQLAGYSIVTLVPPRLKALNGLSLEFHWSVPNTFHNDTIRFPLGQTKFALSSKTWTRELENELNSAGDILLSTLTPLNASVTWFLARGDMDVEEPDEPEVNASKSYAPHVEI